MNGSYVTQNSCWTVTLYAVVTIATFVWCSTENTLNNGHLGTAVFGSYSELREYKFIDILNRNMFAK